jgi:hypothetical protein
MAKTQRHLHTRRTVPSNYLSYTRLSNVSTSLRHSSGPVLPSSSLSVKLSCDIPVLSCRCGTGDLIAPNWMASLTRTTWSCRLCSRFWPFWPRQVYLESIVRLRGDSVSVLTWLSRSFPSIVSTMAKSTAIAFVACCLTFDFVADCVLLWIPRQENFFCDSLSRGTLVLLDHFTNFSHRVLSGGPSGNGFISDQSA